MLALEITDLCKVFRGKKRLRVEALKGVSLAVEQGEIFGFLGPNGAGKSTTIKLLMGLIRASSGQAKILGVDSKSTAARRQVGYLPENPAFYDYLNASEYLSFVGRAFSLPSSVLSERSDFVLKRLGLWDARKRPIRSYSKGMVQRLGLAQVLLHDPEVYILDEPMSGLDPVGRALVKELILELKQAGKCVFFSTHITNDVESICDRVAIITQGELRSVNEVRSILDEGISGYNISWHDRKTAESTKQQYVDKNELNSLLQRLQEQNQEISLIEPQRKNLETFFLDIVNKA